MFLKIAKFLLNNDGLGGLLDLLLVEVVSASDDVAVVDMEAASLVDDAACNISDIVGGSVDVANVVSDSLEKFGSATEITSCVASMAL